VERALAGEDTGVFGLCSAEYPGLAEIWVLFQEKSIGHDGADQGGYEEGNNNFLRLYGADELKMGRRVLFGLFALDYP
jgi:hypothetical protein